MDTARAPLAALFTSFPQPLQLSCLTVLPLADMLRFSTTSPGMRQLCADDVVWQPIYWDLTDRCRLEGVGYWPGQQERDLEVKQQQLLQQQQQQTSYKRKTLVQLLAFFNEEIQRADQILQEALNEERDDFSWRTLEWDAAEGVERLRLRIKAITKALK